MIKIGTKSGSEICSRDVDGIIYYYHKLPNSDKIMKIWFEEGIRSSVTESMYVTHDTKIISQEEFLLEMI